MFEVAVAYSIGKDTEKDVKKAFKWYKKAAKKGHAEAQNELGYAYDYGEGVEKRDHSGCGHTAGHAASIGLLNAHVNGTVGEGLYKAFQTKRAAQVAIDGYHTVIGGSSLAQCIVVHDTHFLGVKIKYGANLYHVKSPPG